MTLTSMLRDLNASAIELEAVNEAVMTLNPGAPPVNVDRLKVMLREVETGAEALLSRVKVLRARHVPPEVVYLTRLPEATEDGTRSMKAESVFGNAATNPLL